MKKLFLLFLLSTLFCCTNNDEECEDLYEQYINSISNSGGSQSVIDELTRQYNAKKADLGCK
ncbi:MAG: hypothetical protein GY739_07145 [Mesoflavibacter sp.]|nr:hypothetical protein [Mesoflavibacter sp.]